jgi:hypothetical protein
MDWARILAFVTGMVDQELLARNEYLAAENRILKAQLKGRLKLSDAERATLGEIGHRLGRKILSEVANVARPDTILAWYRKLVARKFDGSKARRGPGRPRISREVEQLIVRMAKENLDRIALRDRAEVIWKRYQTGNMKGDSGRSMTVIPPESSDGSELSVLPVLVLSEASQQAHHIMVVLFRRREAADDPVEEIRICAIEQSFEPVELRVVEVSEMDLGKSAKYEIALLGSPMPATEQQPPASDILVMLL